MHEAAAPVPRRAAPARRPLSFARALWAGYTGMILEPAEPAF